MYSSDRMITLAGMFKNYDKNIVFKDCQMHFLNIYLRRKKMLLIFFRHFVKLPAKNHYWTLFETLAEIERFQRTTTLHGRLTMDMCLRSCLMSTISPQGTPRNITLDIQMSCTPIGHRGACIPTNCLDMRTPAFV